jgi:hypothetical protein
VIGSKFEDNRFHLSAERHGAGWFSGSVELVRIATPIDGGGRRASRLCAPWCRETAFEGNSVGKDRARFLAANAPKHGGELGIKAENSPAISATSAIFLAGYGAICAGAGTGGDCTGGYVWWERFAAL